VSFLELETLAKTWPDGTRAVRGVNLSLEGGEFIVLLGPSGCGKTTTLRMVAGLETPTSGRVLLAGEDVTALPPGRRDVGFVFQLYALYPHMSVEENVEFPLACAGVARAERQRSVASVLESLGLAPLAKHKPRELSGGDQQRVGLARALVRRPKLWLMDEPLGTLDADRRAEMCAFLRATQLENRVTTLYVTHDQDEALRLADRIVVMSGGEIVQVGSPEDVYDDPVSLFVARFVGSPGMNLIEGEAREGQFFARGSREPVVLDGSRAEGPNVLGFRPERARFDAGGALRGRVALNAFAGACRHVHVQGETCRFVVRAPADWRGREGDEVRVALDRGGIRLFDPSSGRRIP
jgi:multiple sugar transport system ATP-binding protein